MDQGSLKLEVQQIIEKIDIREKKLNLLFEQIEQKTRVELEYNRIVELSKSLPPQGTRKWKEERTDGVGGSEMKIMKKGKDSFGNTIVYIYKRKIGLLTEEEDTIVLLQGHIFEDITKHYIKHKYNIEIANINGPIRSRCNDIAYSMDGLAKVNYKIIQNLDIYEDCSDGVPLRDCLVLFEFKSSYTRQLNKVPDYTDQVYTGLYTFPLIDLCIFTDTCYKICTIDQFYDEKAYARHLYDMYNSYHKVIHAPVAYSIAFFVGNPGDDIYGELSTLSMDAVTYVFGMFRREECTMENGRIFIYEGVDINNKVGYINYMRSYVDSVCEEVKKMGKCVIAYMPWKLYKINFVLYSARDDEITPYIPRINQFMSLVRKYKNASHEEKMSSLKLVESL